MNMEVTKTAGVEYAPVFKKVVEVLTGGAALYADDLPTATEFLAAGVMLAEDSSTSGLYHVCKTAKVYEAVAAAATTVKVMKAHLFKVGDFITNGQVSTAITAIDSTTSDDYDALTITATLDAVESVAINTVLYQGASETTNAAVASTATVEDTADDFLTISNPRGDTNDIIVTIAQASGDTLAVGYTPATKTLLIQLANSTGSKNTTALIQAAIRALAQSGGVDFTDWTATSADSSWGTSQTGGTLTDPSHRMSGGVVKPLNLTAKYVPDCISNNQMDVTKANPSCSAVIRGNVTESAMPYYVTSDQKSALTDRIIFS